MWLCYQFPRELLDGWLAKGKGWGGKYVGQAQRWFFFRFTGQDSEVDLNAHGAEEEYVLRLRHMHALTRPL